ncbi:hypothetical protein GUJ93_ZPchr0014g46588 [Zizania palustris]|uniref:Uncharacterized protein n=1 Tax=Zizania palustris TaxID=103762 RepID=A0A8J5TKL9_ZIZPA|nr:hypothetical protein GUJ93_ZPchr0014g46588 [Zizania palustris]
MIGGASVEWCPCPRCKEGEHDDSSGRCVRSRGEALPAGATVAQGSLILVVTPGAIIQLLPKHVAVGRKGSWFEVIKGVEKLSRGQGRDRRSLGGGGGQGRQRQMERGGVQERDDDAYREGEAMCGTLVRGGSSA